MFGIAAKATWRALFPSKRERECDTMKSVTLSTLGETDPGNEEQRKERDKNWSRVSRLEL